MARYVYGFGQGEADGHGEQIGLLGDKGAGLAEMAALGIPVPPGFTIVSELCSHLAGHRDFPDGLEDQVAAALERVGDLIGARFGDAENPLLVSVRAGAQTRVVGLMGAVLNLGLNDDTVKGLAATLGDARFAYDCYRRFVARYAEAVMGVGREPGGASPFAAILDAKKKERGVATAVELGPEDLKSLVTEYKIEILRKVETPFPEDPYAQLWGAIGAAFRSWSRPAAVAYRTAHGIPASPGCAVNLQAMVFGNLGEDSGAGVLFSREPTTGVPAPSGQYLGNAQGTELRPGGGDRNLGTIADLAQLLAPVHEELLALSDRLEKHFADLLEIEFTIQHGALWLLQVASADRSGSAMVKVAVDLVAEGLIDARTAVLRIDPGKLDELLHPMIAAGETPQVVARGLPAAPGAAVGKVVFSAAEVDEAAARGEAVILVRAENTADDVRAIRNGAGLVIARGGMTSEAAIVARGLGKPCVSSCRDIKVDRDRGHFMVNDVVVRRGDEITVDGSAGVVARGAAVLFEGQRDAAFATLMDWADEFRRLKVHANIETALDARIARDFGAEGVGLCRTEHMFAAADRINAVRAMILADDVAGRRAALDSLLPLHQNDFLEIFRVMDGLPVTIRLLDQPLHDFLPVGDKEVTQVARQLGVRPAKLLAAAEDLRERIPMLGHRGCRLAIRHPEIYELQVRAIANAAVAATAEGLKVRPRIMIPVVSLDGELKLLRAVVSRVFEQVLADAEVTMACRVGALIELPRACMIADRIAEHADFFSFATNDLTQTTFGFSRDDASQFISDYLDREILDSNPFVTLDRDGVGALIRHAVENGRAKKTKLKVGICGEHGGEPSSIEFCHREGFDYVSCSPFRVIIARVAAARAALRREARTR